MIVYFSVMLLVSALLLPILYFLLKKWKKQSNLFFYGSAVYIILGLPMLFSWYLYIGLFFITIGMVLLILAKFSIYKWFQLFLCFLPIFLFSVVVWYQESSYNIFLIPKGYKGRVVIVHSCKDGMKKEFEGRYRIYRIEPNGLLKTKFSFAGNAFDGLHSHFYYVDSEGNREPIDWYDGTNNPNKVVAQGLWSLNYQRKKDTIIDFIVDLPIENIYSYRDSESLQWQNEIDSCM